MSVINATPLLAAAGGDYQISRSVRLRSSASAYFNRTPASAGNRKTWTWSGWVKRGTLGVVSRIFAADDGSSSTDQDYNTLLFNSSNQLQFSGNLTDFRITTAVYRDPSAWYHIVFAVDTTQATAGNRFKLYVNGSEVTTFGTSNNPSQNTDLAVNAAIGHYIGSIAGSSYVDAYLTEFNFIDGQALTPSSFGETDAITGVWKPKKYAGTYGTNGFYLNFSDNSSNTATTIGKDNSGNGNNWTPNNISVTSGVTYDSMIDVPTLYADGGNGRGNYAVVNPLLGGVNNAVMTNGNLTATLTYSSQVNAYSNMPLPTTGKWYWESTVVASNYGVNIGIRSTVNSSLISAGSTGGYSYYNANGNKYDGSTASAYGTSWYGASRTDVIGVAYDADTRELSFYLNGVSQGVAFTVVAGEYYPAASHVSGSGSHTEHYNFGQRPFAYTPPTGFKALNTQNLPAPTILKGNKYFNTVLYTGNGTSQSVSGVGFQPDFVWLKARSNAQNHTLYDAVRGSTKYLISNATTAETTNSETLKTFDSDGFSLGNAFPNDSGYTFVAWNWKANGSAVTNTSGSITSQVSAGTSQGFSVVTYTGTGANATVGHGLGVAPKMVIVKRRDSSGSWNVYHASTGNTGAMYLELTNAFATDSTRWNNTSPTSSVFTVGSGAGVNASGGTMVAYCFSEVAGFSKFGSYTGNGSADGPFVYMGFRPKFILFKNATGAGNSWLIFDTSRTPSNQDFLELKPDGSGAESPAGSYAYFDFLSNGFKPRTSSTGLNASGATMIYAAFAENPFKNSLAR
jgi:hypothetical protein